MGCGAEAPDRKLAAGAHPRELVFGQLAIRWRVGVFLAAIALAMQSPAEHPLFEVVALQWPELERFDIYILVGRVVQLDAERCAQVRLARVDP